MCNSRREAHGACACRALCVEAVCSHCGQPAQRSHLPCPLNRQGTAAAAAHLHAKPAPAQRHAHHCSVCWAARNTHSRAHTRVRAHTHRQTHTHTHTPHTDTHACARTQLNQLFSVASDAPSLVKHESFICRVGRDRLDVCRVRQCVALVSLPEF